MVSFENTSIPPPPFEEEDSAEIEVVGEIKKGDDKGNEEDHPGEDGAKEGATPEGDSDKNKVSKYSIRFQFIKWFLNFSARLQIYLYLNSRFKKKKKMEFQGYFDYRATSQFNIIY